MTLRAYVASLIVVAILAPVAATDQTPQQPCNVTAPNGVVAGSSESQKESFGNPLLSVFGLWPNGAVIFRPGGPGFVTSDGALGMKFLWIRGGRGKVQIAGRRVDHDSAAVPLRWAMHDYADRGIQPSYLIFPTPGCWEVTGQLAGDNESKVTFVTRIVKEGEGPAWRLDPVER